MVHYLSAYILKLVFLPLIILEHRCWTTHDVDYILIYRRLPLIRTKCTPARQVNTLSKYCKRFWTLIENDKVGSQLKNLANLVYVEELASVQVYTFRPRIICYSFLSIRVNTISYCNYVQYPSLPKRRLLWQRGGRGHVRLLGLHAVPLRELARHQRFILEEGISSVQHHR